MQKLTQFFNNLSFGIKVGAALLLVGIVPIAIVSFALVTSASNALQSQTLDKMSTVGKSRQAILENFFQARANEAATLAERESLKGNEQNTAGLPVFWKYKHDHTDKEYLSAYQTTIDGLQNDLKTHTAEYVDIMIYDRIGDRVAQATDPFMATTAEAKVVDQPYFTEAMAGTPYFGDIVDNPLKSGEQVFFVSYPITQYGATDVIGVVVIKGNPTAIDALLNDPTGLGESGEVYLVNSDKLMITNTRLNDTPTRLVEKVESYPVQQALAGKTGVSAYTDYKNETDLGFYAPFPNHNWALVAELDQSEALAPVRQQTEIALVLVALALIAALGMTALLSGFLGRQVNEIQKVFRAAAIGSFDARAKVFGMDELGRTADGVNAMLERLTELLGLAAKTAQQRFSDVVTTMADWVWETDVDANYTYTSDQILNILGFSRDEIIGQPALGFIVPEERQKVAEILAEARANTRPFANLEITTIRKDGNRRTLSMNGVPVIDDHGNYRGMRGTGSDITERKQAEEELRRNEAQLAEATEIAQMAYWELDLQSLEFILNDRFFALLGTTAQQAGGYVLSAENYLRQFVYSEDVSTIQNEIQTTLQNPQPTGNQLEYRAVHADGHIMYITSTYRLAFDENNRPIKGYGTYMDVTEREEAERRLRESEATLRGVFDNMQDAFYRSDKEGHLAWASPSAVRMMGYDSLEDVVGLDMATGFWGYPEQRDLMIQELRRSGRVLDYELEVRRKDGNLLPVSTSSSYYKDANGEIIGVEGTFRDITQRKQAEAALRESERLLRSIIDATKDWIFLKDTNYRYMVVNEAFAYEYGRLTPDEMVGKDDYELGTPTYLIEGDPERGIRGFRADDRAVVENKQTLTNPFDVVNFRDGTEHVFDTTKAPLYNAQGEILGGLGVSRDITERKQAEDQIEEQNKALARALDELRGLMAGVETAAGQVTGASGTLQSIVELIAGQAATGADMAAEATGSAQEGGTAVNDTVSAMGRIRETTQETARRIKKLGEVSQEIGEVVRLIDEIADRVTVLALNASIQAAAAGDAGRGFAVVAEEVQRLAERATGATRQIENLIKGVQGEINEAMVSVEEVTQEVVGGSQLAQNAGDRMTDLSRVVNDLASLIQHISQTTTRQTAESLVTLTTLAENLRSSVAALRTPEEEAASGNGHGGVQTTAAG